MINNQFNVGITHINVGKNKNCTIPTTNVLNYATPPLLFRENIFPWNQNHLIFYCILLEDKNTAENEAQISTQRPEKQALILERNFKEQLIDLWQSTDTAL